MHNAVDVASSACVCACFVVTMLGPSKPANASEKSQGYVAAQKSPVSVAKKRPAPFELLAQGASVRQAWATF